MRPLSLLCVCLLVLACGDEAPKDGVDTDTDTTASDTDTDTDTPPVDADGDGFDTTEDCDDDDASVYPGADEYCDDIDSDCDGSLDDGDEIDIRDWYVDADGDGSGDANAPTAAACDPPTGYAGGSADCDDTDDAIHPGADEYCDDVDSDCDGLLDDGDELDLILWYRDFDNDGYGDASDWTRACDQPSGYILDNTDCNDGIGAVYPGADEYCDFLDSDCDGSTDDGDEVDISTWFLDFDGDGYGDQYGFLTACDVPPGFTADDTDCNDLNNTIHPGAVEYCDLIDSDCDSLLDDGDEIDAATWYDDRDLDGFGDPTDTVTACDMPNGYVADDTDCDDRAPTVYPGAAGPCENCDTRRMVPDDYGAIQPAIDAAIDGDAVCVSDGTWYENLILDASVSIIGNGVVVIDGSSAGRVLDIGAGVDDTTRIQNLSFANGLDCLGAALYIEGSPVFEDVEVFFNAARGVDCGQIVMVVGPTAEPVFRRFTYWGNFIDSTDVAQVHIGANGGSEATFENFEIVANTAASGGEGGGILGTDASRMVLLNGIISGNTTTAVGVYRDYLLAFIGDSGRANEIYIENVTIHGNDATSTTNGIDSGIHLMEVDAVAVNLSITDNTTTVALTTGELVVNAAASTFATSYGNYSGNTATGFSGLPDPIGSNGNISVVPGFVDDSNIDATRWDLTLAFGSALIDAGDPALLDPDGSTSDIGAYGGPLADAY